VPDVGPLVLEAEDESADLVQEGGPVNLIPQVGGVELLDRAGERAEGGEVRAHRVGVEGAESPVVGHGAGEAAVGWIEMPLEVEVRPAEIDDLRHQRGSPRSSLWSPMEAEPANDSTTTSLPSMERVSVAPRIRAFRPTSVWESVLSVTSVPASRVTLGPMVLRSTVTPSSISTGSWMVTPGKARRRAWPLWSRISFDSSSVSSLPQSYQPPTSAVRIFFPASIMCWKASVR